MRALPHDASRPCGGRSRPPSEERKRASTGACVTRRPTAAARVPRVFGVFPAYTAARVCAPSRMRSPAAQWRRHWATACGQDGPVRDAVRSARQHDARRRARRARLLRRSAQGGLVDGQRDLREVVRRDARASRAAVERAVWRRRARVHGRSRAVGEAHLRIRHDRRAAHGGRAQARTAPTAGDARRPAGERPPIIAAGAAAARGRAIRTVRRALRHAAMRFCARTRASALRLPVGARDEPMWFLAPRGEMSTRTSRLEPVSNTSARGSRRAVPGAARRPDGARSAPRRAPARRPRSGAGIQKRA